MSAGDWLGVVILVASIGWAAFITVVAIALGRKISRRK